jgi:hypothetical protein
VRENREFIAGGLPLPCRGGKLPAENAQGIEAEIPEQTAERFVRNWSGKPGFRRFAPEMRPNSEKSLSFTVSA